MIKRIGYIEAKKVECKSNYIDETRGKGKELVFKIGHTYDIIGRISETNEYLVKTEFDDIYVCDADDVKFIFKAEV